MVRNALFFAAAALSMAVAASPAAAAEVAVSYQDLDLSTQEGRDVLARRLDSAARQACGYGEASLTGTRTISKSAKSCYAKAKSSSRDTLAAILRQNGFGG